MDDLQTNSNLGVYNNRIDIHDPEFTRDPYPTYAELREKCPVVHSDLYGSFWMLTRYLDVRTAALDWRTYTSSVPGVTAIPIITPRTKPMLPIELDPPQHSKYRALVQPVFSGERIETLRTAVREIAAELAARLARRGGGDLVTEYAEPLSLRTLAAFAGLPVEDAPKWLSWIRSMFDVRDPAGREQASAEMGAYIHALIAARRQSPGEDFISLLMESSVDGQKLTVEEIYSFCTVLFGAGFETTADGLSVMLHYLAQHPADRLSLLSQPELIAPAVEEFLRYSSPIQIFGRNATRDLALHGAGIRSGDIVALSFGSANQDPEVFANPERCILDRAPNRHLAFGAGPHLCLGAPVARLEMSVTLEEFLPRIPDFCQEPGQAVQWKGRGDRRGLAALPVVIPSSRSGQTA